MTNKLISIKEAASILGVSKLTLRNWDRDGKLVALRHPINNYRVYKLEDIENLMTMIKPKDTPPKPPKRYKNEVWNIKVNHIKD